MLGLKVGLQGSGVVMLRVTTVIGQGWVGMGVAMDRDRKSGIGQGRGEVNGRLRSSLTGRVLHYLRRWVTAHDSHFTMIH